MNLEHGIYQISNLEIRQGGHGPQGSGAGRSVTGHFGYAPSGSVRRMATVRATGTDRKEMIEEGAFNFSISTIKRLKAEYDELLKQGAQTEVLETAKQELMRRDIHILGGHNWNKVLGSVAAGSAFIDEVLDDPEDPHVSFAIPLPEDESILPTYFQDTIKEIELGLAGGVSPAFFLPPPEKVPDAESFIPEPGNPGVRIRVIKNAVLVEMSILSRPAYTETGVDVRQFDMYEPARKKRVKRWL